MFAAIILAGGLGTRLRSVVSNVPKPMAPIKNKPFLTYQLDYWIEQGVKRFILAVGYKYEAIINFFGDSYRGAMLDYVIEESPLGTGGGLLLAAKKIDAGAFLLLNGDTYFAVDLHRLVEFSIKSNADWCFSLFRTNDNKRYLTLEVLPDGQIISFNNTSNLANGGVYWLKKSALNSYLPFVEKNISLESDILPNSLMNGKRIFGLEFSGIFIDIGIPKDYYQAEFVL